MKIRWATKEDAGTLRRMRLRMMEEWACPLPRGIEGRVQAYLEKHLADESCLCAVTESGGEVIAMAMLCRYEEMPDEVSAEGKSAKLSSVYTLPAYRGKGCMEQLLLYLLEEAKRRGIGEIFVSSERKAIPLFERVGFRLAETMLYMELAPAAENDGTPETRRDLHPDHEYAAATEERLQSIWEKNIKANGDDERWLKWREEAIADNRCGKAKTFLVLFKGEPVGEGTLLFADDCAAIRGRTVLADGRKTANINALRIEKEHEGKGHISKLVRLMERYAAEHGYEKLTIGVEAKEARNLAIYLHWGYQELVHAETEDDSLVLYYAKGLPSPAKCDTITTIG